MIKLEQIAQTGVLRIGDATIARQFEPFNLHLMCEYMSKQINSNILSFEELHELFTYPEDPNLWDLPSGIWRNILPVWRRILVEDYSCVSNMVSLPSEYWLRMQKFAFQQYSAFNSLYPDKYNPFMNDFLLLTKVLSSHLSDNSVDQTLEQAITCCHNREYKIRLLLNAPQKWAKEKPYLFDVPDPFFQELREALITPRKMSEHRFFDKGDLHDYNDEFILIHTNENYARMPSCCYSLGYNRNDFEKLPAGGSSDYAVSLRVLTLSNTLDLVKLFAGQTRHLRDGMLATMFFPPVMHSVSNAVNFILSFNQLSGAITPHNMHNIISFAHERVKPKGYLPC